MVVPARCVRDGATVRSALVGMKQLRDRIDRVVASGARMGATKTGDPVSCVIRDLMLPRILAHGSTP
jgi:hypothetical protein